MLKKHKTTIYTDKDNYLTVIYHSTPVVQFNYDEIILNTGGWFTKTTKDRMNQASDQFNLGYGIYQKNFDWFITYNNETIPFDSNVKRLKRS